MEERLQVSRSNQSTQLVRSSIDAAFFLDASASSSLSSREAFLCSNNNFHSMRIIGITLAAGSLLACLCASASAEDEAPASVPALAAAAEAEHPVAAMDADKSAAVMEADHPAAAMDAGQRAAANMEPESQTETVVSDSAEAGVFERIRSGFAMTDFDSALVREAQAWYASRPDYVQRMVERSRRYLYFVVQEVEKRGMPTEIALLPMIESAYNPLAYSPARAVGIWQFVAATGKTYGLKQDWWYDGRRDVVEATRAALDYLQNLYAMFGDWELALAAYNWGEGAVARALLRNEAKGLPIDYRSLRLPQETRGYIPRLMAVKNIVRDPGAYGLELEPVPNQPYFETVKTTRPMDVKVAARLAEIPVEEFQALNPGYSRPVIPADEPQTLLLPAEKVATFLENLDSHDRPLSTWQIYHARLGEKLEKIAAQYGLSVSRLKEINGIPARGRVRSVNTLLVPVRSGAGEPLLDTAGFIAPAVETRAPVKLAVKKGTGHAKAATRSAAVGKMAAKRGPAKPLMLADARRRVR
jgi:peptidoglycan lytic transglycosylase D